MDTEMVKRQNAPEKPYINISLLGQTGNESVTFTVIILYNKYRFCIRLF